MIIKSKQIFVLIGDDKTGKTTMQKLLIEKLCGYIYDTLPVNRVFPITHPEIKRKYQNISFGNRSYQEKRHTYGSVDDYFKNHFEPADICFVSSHLVQADTVEIIRNGKSMFYNVNAIFFTNSIAVNTPSNSQISLLDWDERFVVENNLAVDSQTINKQLNQIADNIVFLIANRTSVS